MPVRIERFCKTTRWFHWSFVSLVSRPRLERAALLALRDELGLGSATRDALVDFHEGAAVALSSLPALVAALRPHRRELARLRRGAALEPHRPALARAPAARPPSAARSSRPPAS